MQVALGTSREFPIMTLGDLLGPDVSLAGPWADVTVTGLTADSRDVRPGFVFAALPGTETDGARFIPDAIAAGAVALLLPTGSRAATDAGTPVVFDDDPRRRLALMAARFFGTQPDTVAAVTGTNGKTSVAAFLRQIWVRLGYDAASLGTVGVVSQRGARPLIHTTPEPVTLHRLLLELVEEGVTHLALEASSHGLQQRRLDGVRVSAAAFTNISRDHLDYHDSFEAYLAEKMRLFQVLLEPSAPIVVDPEAPGADTVCNFARTDGRSLLTVGRTGTLLRLLSADREGTGQRLKLTCEGKEHDLLLPLPGAFQVSNALTAAGLAIALGSDAASVLETLTGLEGAKGRLEHVGQTASGASVFIDYAHTPDALANALVALRPYASGRMIVVFGCGGDRDRGKRPEMGRAAGDHADLVIVTDDNPRGEDPAAIRAAALAAVPTAREIGDRSTAITAAINEAGEGDLVLIAGKGHETGQTIGNTVLPFSDHDAVRSALAGEDK